MLFDVAALLSTSAALGPAAEAFVAPVSISISAPLNSTDTLPPITTAPSGALVDPADLTHGVPVTTFQVPQTTLTELRTLSGISFVQALSGLSAERIGKIVATDPGLITRLLAAPPTASDTRALWDTIDVAARARLESSAPRLVGNLNGLPVSVRNTANRLWVSQEIAGLKAKLASTNGRVLAESEQQQLHMLTRVGAALKPTRLGPKRTLLSLDMSGQGKAVIVLGDLTTAKYVTYMVPGMFYNVDGQLGAWTGDAEDLYQQQVAWLKRVGSVDPSASHRSVAVVAWMGYQTPDLTNIADLKLANQARDALARDVEGMQSLRSSNEPFTTIVAHSYGSTAALMALTQYDFSVDALVLVGTPGSAAQSAKDLHVSDTNVWVGSAPWDPVPTSAFFGSDPSAPSYGAHTLGVNGGIDVITGKPLVQSLGHNEYFDANTESIRNMALIAIDQAGLVMQDDAADAHRTLADAK